MKTKNKKAKIKEKDVETNVDLMEVAADESTEDEIKLQVTAVNNKSIDESNTNEILEVNSGSHNEITIDNDKSKEEKVEEDSVKEAITDMEEVSVDNKKNNNKDNKASKELKKKKIIIGCSISAASAIVIYLAVALYFNNRFYFGSQINGLVATGKTVEAMTTEVIAQSQMYQLELVGRDGTTATISGPDISLEYTLGNEIETFKEEQNPFQWVVGIVEKNELSLTQDVSYDKSQLESIIEKFEFFNTSKIVEPQNASVQFKDNEYVVIDEVMGNKVQGEKLYDMIVEAIASGDTVLNLDESDCYENPKYLATSTAVLEAKDTLNKYVGTEVTYTFGDTSEIVNASVINQWLEVDEEFKPVINEEKVSGYVQELASKYNTYGSTRDFKSSHGTTVQVYGGDYGWIVNKAEEAQELVANVQAGEPVSREPIFSQRADRYGSNDIGNTYVEIDLSGQYIWFYKDGSLIVESNIVTGNINNGWGTPQGTYVLKYKQRDTVLRGDNYASPVSFWMPFNGGIGLHDATWRSSFGGSIYKSNGSHGCVNLPYSVAQKIFGNIESGTPVVCYF